MMIPEIGKQEGLVDYAEKLSDLYSEAYNPTVRKLKGQFFTPTKVALYMASLFSMDAGNSIHLLDPGAGTGILTAAFCEHLLLHIETNTNLTIDVYENDPSLLPLLKSVLSSCKQRLEQKGHIVNYFIYEQDFILHNKAFFRRRSSLDSVDESLLYDFIISNPPYYKINKDSPHSAAMLELISGQPNIYALFMALSAAMLKTGGEMVFITPRSFCSGLYYKKFREWFLSKVKIDLIHIFESRKEVFYKDKVLQENIIVKATAPKREGKYAIDIAVCNDINFYDMRSLKVTSADVLFHKNGDIFIRIPISEADIKIQHIIDRWANTLNGLGLEISTGPVVAFRNKEYLLLELSDPEKEVPLLWMHNMQATEVIWPAKKNTKPTAIRVCPETKPVLLPVKNYVLIKRFSSKEQKRRLYASVLKKADFPYKMVGIENHVNYVYRPKAELTEYEALGIQALLNTALIDRYFRTLNGNTQVNAIDIRCLPLPDVKDIVKIGELLSRKKSILIDCELDLIVASVLNVDIALINKLYNYKE